jgi:hypothetical protein
LLGAHWWAIELIHIRVFACTGIGVNSTCSI